MNRRIYASIIGICLLFAGFLVGHFLYNKKESQLFTCTDNVFTQIYPNQNGCLLLSGVPTELINQNFTTLPDDITYNTVRFNFNKRFNVFPHAILTPSNDTELSFIIKITQELNLSFSIRSGGHCAEPASLSMGYIVDLSNMSSIKLDLKKEEAIIGAGCRLGTIVETLGKQNYAIPTGTCQSVAIGGLALGGGLGMLSRPFGLTCDSIKSMRVITADGNTIETSADNYPDLFWALKGAGNGSFGVVTDFTFAIQQIKEVSTFEMDWTWDETRIPEIIQIWQTWVKTLPDTITTQMQLWYLNGNANIAITGVKVGNEPFREWEEAFKDLRPNINIYKESYIDSAKRWSGVYTAPFNKGKSSILVEPLSEEAIQEIILFFKQLQNDKAEQYVYLEMEGFGGKIPQGDNAFSSKNAFGWLYQVIYWQQQVSEANSLKYINDFHEKLTTHVSKHAYANIVDYDLGENYLEAYYGDYVDRLIEVKNKYDPMDFFHWKQSIPLKKNSSVP